MNTADRPREQPGKTGSVAGAQSDLLSSPSEGIGLPELNSGDPQLTLLFNILITIKSKFPGYYENSSRP